MTWFRVDDNLAFHPKVLAAGNAAMGLWVRAGSWAAQQLTDGHVPDAMVATLGTKAAARQLEAAGLWHRDGDGYRFHDWEHRQPTRATVDADREREREKKRRQRAAGHRAVDTDPTTGRYVSPGDTPRDDPGDSGGESPATRPVPSRPSTHSQSSVESRTRPELDDDDLAVAIAQARARRLHRPNPTPGWLRSVAAGLDIRRARALATEGLDAADIDVALDQAPRPAEPRPGPALPAAWQPTDVPDALPMAEGARKLRAVRGALA